MCVECSKLVLVNGIGGCVLLVARSYCARFELRTVGGWHARKLDLYAFHVRARAQTYVVRCCVLWYIYDMYI